ncbi:MAG: tetraacyldisaccharide 4'-kinase [Desulfuromonadales bacterium]|nr:tetraacyldisaccharide 4'-kinase [Desulfuromonadales bacterium]
MSRFQQFHRRIVLQGAKLPVEKLLLLLLMPFSFLYGMVGWLRGKCYDRQIFSIYRPAVPVISVGNLAAGGTGKTPVVDWLLKEFIRQGKRPAVVSRGYAGTFRGKVGLVATGTGPLLSATEAGDEPYLLARRNPQALVFIARRRADGVKVAVEEYAADLIILDDGFQHRAVARSLDLVLLDAKCPLGNGLPLPAGLLREFPSALHRADLLLLTRSETESAFGFSTKPVFKSQHRLAEYAVQLGGKQVPFAALSKQRLFAFAGIADPENFFSSLKLAGLQIADRLVLSDHSDYNPGILESIRAAAKGFDGLITTEKDAVKLAAESFELPCYQVPMSIHVENVDDFKAEIVQRLWRKQNGSTS